ncbi:DUF6389 family protein [Stenotrophomonas humi]
MDQAHYCREVKAVLDSHLDQIRGRIQATFLALPEKAKEITLGVHVDQDGDGLLTIQVHLTGPDLYVLNKAISGTATLFDTVMTQTGLDPPLPVMSPGEDDFSVADALADCAIEWLESHWLAFQAPPVALPISIASIGDYGSIGLVRLRSHGA